jgi:thioredoxin 1
MVTDGKEEVFPTIELAPDRKDLRLYSNTVRQMLDAAQTANASAYVEIVRPAAFFQKIEQLRQSNLPLVIQFGADWCEACHTFKPIFAETSLLFKERAHFIYVDLTDDDTGLAEVYSKLPTIEIYKAGRITFSQSSLLDVPEFRALLLDEGV